MDTHLPYYALGCLVMLGFFVGNEIAFVSVSRLNIELKKKQGGITGRILGRFIDYPSTFIGTSLVGILILMVIYSLLMSKLTTEILTFNAIHFDSPYIKIVLDILLATTLLFLFSELLPKSYFRTKSEAVLSFFALPMLLMYYLLYPLVKIFVVVASFILKYFFNVRMKENFQTFDRVDLEHFVNQTMRGEEENYKEINTELFKNALQLANTKLRNCLVPRNEITGIPIHATMEEAIKKFTDTKLTKIIVYEGNLDNIKGYLHQLDLLKKPSKITDILHSIHAVPEAMRAADVLKVFTKERKSIAWVVDEYGGTAGIITMEDVLEEIFGDIKDEHDHEQLLEKQISENEYLLSGRLEIDYINEKYGFDFPVTHSETLSGYIISHHKSIPVNKERIIIGLYEFEALLVTDTRIETVKLKVLKPL